MNDLARIVLGQESSAVTLHLQVTSLACLLRLFVAGHFHKYQQRKHALSVLALLCYIHLHKLPKKRLSGMPYFNLI